MKATVIDRKEFLKMLDKKRNGRSMTVVAPELGVSHQFLAKVVRGDYLPGPKLAAALGFEPVEMYRRIPRRIVQAAKAGRKQIMAEALAPFEKTKSHKRKRATGMKAPEFDPAKMEA